MRRSCVLALPWIATHVTDWQIALERYLHGGTRLLERWLIELEERVVTLSGTVESQYAQWREILADIYANETGTAQ